MLSGDTVTAAIVFVTKTLENKDMSCNSVKFKFGVKAWDDLLKMEGTIRKKRQELIYKRQELKQRMIEGLFVVILICSLVGLIFFAIWLKKQQDGN